MSGNTAAGWLPDPTGRSEVRFWDGAQWTDHVATGGEQAQDPYEAAMPPAPPGAAPLPAVVESTSPSSSQPGPAALGPAITGQPVNSADVREVEATVWEGETQNLTALASKGKVVNARYRLTNHALYVNAGVVGSSETRLPLAQVSDVSVQQSIVQKRRRVGTLTLRFQAEGAQFPQMKQIDSVSNPTELRDLILKYAAHERQRASRSHRTFYAGN